MNILLTRDLQEHRDQKRKIANAYSLPNLLQSEDAIDSCSMLFMDRLNEFASKNEPVDLGAWLQYYVFDVVGEVTFAS
jgi:Cytochrome P450